MLGDRGNTEGERRRMSLARAEEPEKRPNRRAEKGETGIDRATWTQFILLGRRALEKTGMTKEQVRDIAAKVREEVYGDRR